MINLVPNETRAKLSLFYRERLAIVFLVCSLFCLLFGIVFLILPYRLAKEKTVSVEKNMAISKALSSARMESNPEFEAKELSRRIELITGKSTGIAPHRIIESILNDRPSKTKVDGLSYYGSGVRGGSLEIRGVAEDRASLLDFVRRLENNPVFSGVKVPVSNFVEEKNLSFNITLAVKVKK